MDTVKRLFKVALFNWRLMRGKERYQIIEKQFNKSDFIKMIDGKIVACKGNNYEIIKVALPIVYWQELDIDYYNRVYDGWTPYAPFLEKRLMNVVEFIKLVESRRVKLIDYDAEDRTGTFEVIKKIDAIENMKVFIGPLSGVKFEFEQYSDDVKIVDKNEVSIQVVKADFVAFLNYVAADLG